MGSKYNLIAGRNLDRLCAISDGLFAVAMTLLVLDLRVPASEAIHSEGALREALGSLSLHLVPYVLCFMTLGIFWIGQQTQLNALHRSDRNLSWIHIAFLLVVSFLPFSTALLATFMTFRTALLVYWFNVFLLGAILALSWRYARHAGLISDTIDRRFAASVERRIVIAQLLYAFGAALCALGTYWSIAFIFALQFNYALAPRVPLLEKL